jgi:hypothetical protein
MATRDLFRGPLLREPTLHFALLAGVLFLAAAAVGGDDEEVIEIDRGTVEATVAGIGAERGVPLSAEERRAVERALIEEEVLVREALAMNLDQDDPRIRDILAQKMLHVLSADVIQPTEAELSAYYEANRERYGMSGTMMVDELVVPVQGPLPPALERQLREGVPAEALVSDLALTPRRIPEASFEDLVVVFGPETASLVSEAEAGRWVGPHRSVRGQHWFRIVEGAAPRVPAIEEIREQVRLDWIAEQETARLQQRVAELTSRYSVVIGEGSDR